MTDDALRFLRRQRVARLATADASGRPHLVPVVFVLHENRLFIPIDHKPKQHSDPNNLRRVSNIRENPRASLLVDRYEEDWRRLTWVRVDGPAQLVNRDPAYGEGARALTSKYPQYLKHPLPPEGIGLLVVIHIETVRAWRAG